MIKYIVVFIFLAGTAQAAVTATITSVEKQDGGVVLTISVNDNGTAFIMKAGIENTELDSVSTSSQLRSDVLNPKIMSEVQRVRKSNGAYNFINNNIGNKFTVQ